METPERHESGNLSAFVTGALVGAGVALLLTPESGTELRKFLRDFMVRAKDQLDDAADHGADAWDSTSDLGEEFVEKGKESLHEAGRRTREFAEEGRKKVKEAKDELSSQHR
jgi:gas vesicle protein